MSEYAMAEQEEESASKDGKGRARRFSLKDQLLIQFDRALQTLSGQYEGTGRENPANGLPDEPVDPRQRMLSGRLMRVNHSGEVAAQALYYGQAFMTGDPALRAHLEKSAREEADHLIWCSERLTQLHAAPSVFNPLWYATSWGMGAVAAALGNGYNMGLVVEVEEQVEAHLNDHLDQLPLDDEVSRVILETMQADEIRHAFHAQERGALPLPYPVSFTMQVSSNFLTQGSLWV